MLRASIVIPNYNGKHLLQKHLPSVLAAVRDGDEVIIVDDASMDNTVQFLKKQYPMIRMIQHTKNMRFAYACNAGVRAASHDIVVLLNNDTSPKKDFLAPLLAHFHDQGIFAVGCQELDNWNVPSGRSEGAFLKGMLVHRRAQDQYQSTTLWAAGGSMAVRKTLWEKLGGMDELFYPAYEEDRDLSYRALKMGYRVLFEPKSVVLHQHETTNKIALGKQELQLASYKNLFIFYWKNISDLSLCLLHLLWLPYHLIVGGWKTRGLLVIGFLRAVKQFPSIWRKRMELYPQWKVSDREVVKKAGTW